MQELAALNKYSSTNRGRISPELLLTVFWTTGINTFLGPWLAG